MHVEFLRHLSGYLSHGKGSVSKEGKQVKIRFVPPTEGTQHGLPHFLFFFQDRVRWGGFGPLPNSIGIVQALIPGLPLLEFFIPPIFWKGFHLRESLMAWVRETSFG